MPQETKAVLHQTQHAATQGLEATAEDPVAMRKAIELAVDYRGDVTISVRSDFVLPSGVGEVDSSISQIECFIFDIKRERGEVVAVRAIPKDRHEKLSIPVEALTSIAFTGRDTAAGRSFETWMKNYVKKKLAGEEASIHSEVMD